MITTVLVLASRTVNLAVALKSTRNTVTRATNEVADRTGMQVRTVSFIKSVLAVLQSIAQPFERNTSLGIGKGSTVKLRCIIAG